MFYNVQRIVELLLAILGLAAIVAFLTFVLLWLFDSWVIDLVGQMLKAAYCKVLVRS